MSRLLTLPVVMDDGSDGACTFCETCLADRREKRAAHVALAEEFTIRLDAEGEVSTDPRETCFDCCRGGEEE